MSVDSFGNVNAVIEKIDKLPTTQLHGSRASSELFSKKFIFDNSINLKLRMKLNNGKFRYKGKAVGSD